MQTVFLEALRIPIFGGVTLLLADEARPDAQTFSVSLPQDYSAVPSTRSLDAPRAGDRPPFVYDSAAPERGLNTLRIFELRDYLWELERIDELLEVFITSSLQKSTDSDLWRARKHHGRFRFVNFLGTAWIEVTVAGFPPRRISFEVASPKLDYEQEYRSMVESIGSECQQLLLEWGTPTSLTLIANPAKRAQTILEQFLFLRHMLGPDRLSLYLEIIQRQPHSRLESERDWRPAGAANQSLFLQDPLHHGRGWHWSGVDLVAEELREERRFDFLDTPPNRFLKFALKSFRNLCDEVFQVQQWPAESPVVREAEALQASLDSFLALPLFNDVGELQRIPFESTTLQRREGYREILQAWLMLDAAAQIDWPGRGEAYKGTSRNVATLYEYWLFFILVRAFRDDLRMSAEDGPLATVDGALPFCCHAEDSRLLINLKQGRESFCRFRWHPNPASPRELVVHLFYNRSFGLSSIGERGTYSKTFRPDYTLVIIPEEFAGLQWEAAERAAEASGRIAYLHFDAKYRGENLPGIFGTDAGDEDDPVGERAKASGNAKKADLYKMHTYNEAIRRTVGSYVLYPGDQPSDKVGENRFQRYHEIIPGIGAFALRPALNGTRPAGLNAVCNFIRDILTHQLDRFTQSYRISRNTEETIRECPVEFARAGDKPELISMPEANAILGYMKKADIQPFAAGKFFYCRATDQVGTPLALDISAAQGAVLIGWTGPVTGPFQTTSWMARITSCRLVGKEALVQETGAKSSSESIHYLLFRFEDVSPFDPRDITVLVSKKNGSGEGGKFRTFQIRLKEIYQHQLVQDGLVMVATPSAVAAGAE